MLSTLLEHNCNNTEFKCNTSIILFEFNPYSYSSSEESNKQLHSNSIYSILCYILRYLWLYALKRWGNAKYELPPLWIITSITPMACASSPYAPHSPPHRHFLRRSYYYIESIALRLVHRIQCLCSPVTGAQQKWRPRELTINK